MLFSVTFSFSEFKLNSILKTLLHDVYMKLKTTAGIEMLHTLMNIS